MGLSAAFMGSVIAACGSDDDLRHRRTGDQGSGRDDAPVRHCGRRRHQAGRHAAHRLAEARAAPSTRSPWTTSVRTRRSPPASSTSAARATAPNWRPMLAESWEPNADGSVWTFKLRQGVKWHDGTPFTAADVVATLDRLAVGNLKAYIEAGAGKAVDDITVDDHAERPRRPVPVPGVDLQPAVGHHPGRLRHGHHARQAPRRHRPVQARPSTTSPPAPRSRPTPTGGAASRTSTRSSSSSPTTSPRRSPVCRAARPTPSCSSRWSAGDALLADPNITVESIQGAAHRQMWMNTREGDFTDVRVRQAVALGIDRQALIDTVLQGKGDIGNDHPIAPVYPFFDCSQPQRERDIEKAKQLLEGRRQGRAAATMYVPKLQEIPQLAELMQSQLKDIGMDITLNVESTDTVLRPVVQGVRLHGRARRLRRRQGLRHRRLRQPWHARRVPGEGLRHRRVELGALHLRAVPRRGGGSTRPRSTSTAARRRSRTSRRSPTRTCPYVIPYFYNSLTAYSKNGQRHRRHRPRPLLLRQGRLHRLSRCRLNRTSRPCVLARPVGPATGLCRTPVSPHLKGAPWADICCDAWCRPWSRCGCWRPSCS